MCVRTTSLSWFYLRSASNVGSCSRCSSGTCTESRVSIIQSCGHAGKVCETLFYPVCDSAALQGCPTAHYGGLVRRDRSLQSLSGLLQGHVLRWPLQMLPRPMSEPCIGDWTWFPLEKAHLLDMHHGQKTPLLGVSRDGHPPSNSPTPVERVDGSPQLGLPSDLLSKSKAFGAAIFLKPGELGVQNPVIFQCFWGLRAKHMRFA